MYEIFNPPFHRFAGKSLAVLGQAERFSAAEVAELPAYFVWFVETMPSRIEMLCARIAESEPDFGGELTADGISIVEIWLRANARTRSLRTEALDAVPSEETLSLAVDIGMFYGQALLAHVPGTSWRQKLTSPNDVDYGQPVIAGFLAPPNPVRIAITAAYALANGKPTRLRSSYDHWATKATRALT